MQPAFALHWQAPAGTSYQATMWLPYLKRLGKPYFVLVRTATNFNDVCKVTDAPVILRSGMSELDSIVCDSLKVMFYVNTATRNDHVLRYTKLTHVQLNHGDSDKAPSHNPMFRVYDRNFVAGQAAIDRFAANGVWMPKEMFSIVGRPQVSEVRQAGVHISEVAAPTLLYAPTWSGFYSDSDYSSLSVGLEMLTQALARGATVIFRPHPYARRNPRDKAACEQIIELLAKDAAESSRKHVFGDEAENQLSIVECFNASDAMISDVSSVVGDYLFSEKPFAITAITTPAEHFAAEYPVARAGYVVDAHKRELRGFESVLDDLFGADPLRQVRKEMKSYYLGDISSQDYAGRFFSEARKLFGDAG
jgi:hypothetical protein